MSERYVAGIATGREGGEFMSSAVHDTVTGKIYTIGGDLEKAEEYADLCNRGMPNYLIPGVFLKFQTIQEALNG